MLFDRRSFFYVYDVSRESCDLLRSIPIQQGLESDMAVQKWSEKKIEQLQKEGRGQGQGADYRPWLEAFDFSSSGHTRRIRSPKTGREHVLFSDIEYRFFLCAEWSRQVVDIREQFPLDRTLTQTIADQLGIRHPCYPNTHVPAVMTADFLLTLNRGDTTEEVAINLKPDGEAESQISLEKMELQRSYFEELGVEHHLILKSAIPANAARNIEHIRMAQLREHEAEQWDGYYQELQAAMASRLAAPSPREQEQTAPRLAQSFDELYGLEPGTGLRVLKMLICSRAIEVDLHCPDIMAEPWQKLIAPSEGPAEVPRRET